MCPSNGFFTLSSRQQICLLTSVGGDPLAMLLSGAGWGVKGTIAILRLTSVRPQARAHTNMAALSWLLCYGISMAQPAHQEQLVNPGMRTQAPPLWCITRPCRKPFFCWKLCRAGWKFSIIRNIPQGPWGLTAPQPYPEPSVPEICPFPAAMSLCSAPSAQSQGDTSTPPKASTSSGSNPISLLVRTNMEMQHKNSRIETEEMLRCFC